MVGNIDIVARDGTTCDFDSGIKKTGSGASEGSTGGGY
jgi:hypothetical protein